MPRVLNQTRYRIPFPVDMLDDLKFVSEQSCTPVAELVRRAADFAITFNMPPRSHPLTILGTSRSTFMLYMPDKLWEELNIRCEQDGRLQHVSEFLLQTIAIYLRHRKHFIREHLTAQ